MHKLYDDEVQIELEISDPTYVLLHAPNTINESTLGVDTLEMIRKTVNEWVEEEQR
jgi:hypothetical protein